MKIHSLVLMAVCFTLPSKPTQGARILAVLPIFARSHHRFFQPVLKSLAKAGHEVVVYSPFPLDTPLPNYTDVVLDNVSTENKNITDKILSMIKSPVWKCVDRVFLVAEQILKDFVESDKIQKLLSSNEHFDLIMSEFLLAHDITLILGHVFKAPIIGLQSHCTISVANSLFGNDLSLSYIPDLCTSFSNKMTFYERALNSIYILRGLYYVYYHKYLPYLDTALRHHFPDVPPLLDMVNNVSLIFVNDHPTADYARPRTPNIIPIGGIHIEDEKQLPEPIKAFMDEATDGLILFSLGTYVPDELQAMEYFDMYVSVFSQLRQRVLWKTRKGDIQGLPDNVMTVKWTPQLDVLAHPNCVLFITHGGLLSEHEAIHCGVPVVSIPQFGDQRRNGRFYEEQGIGVTVSIPELSENNILSAIRTVTDNPRYANNMKRLSQVFRDRPLTPAQTVVYWTEYVLRHGASHLRPASTQLAWYQLALLDVLGTILAVLTSLCVVTYFVFRKAVLCLSGNGGCTTIKQKSI